MRILRYGSSYNVFYLQKKTSPKVSDLNQSDIAEMIGISVDTLNNYKKLTELIPELEDLVDTGVVTKSLITIQTNNLVRITYM